MPRSNLALKSYSKYDFDMERVTVTIDEKTLEAIRQVAGPRGVSAFLETAAKERVARLRLLGLLDALDAQYGAPSSATRRSVDRQARAIFGRRK